jgi:excisionase family DNA binding protein
MTYNPHMTAAQVAKKIGVSSEAIYAAIRRGKLAATKRGRDWWITPGALAQYEANRSKRGRPRKETTQ